MKERTEAQKKIVTRFAPSPTGFMHVGGVRTALFAWAFAKKHNGTFILRIEDTDRAREVPGSIEQIMESLKWIGIEWNEGPDIGGPHGPYIQSQRLESYKKYAQMLFDAGLAYADIRTNEELDAIRTEVMKDGKLFLHREHRPENPPAWDGTQPLKLKVPYVKAYEWHDLVRGNMKAGEESVDDFILMKSDGYPTYNFAHIIDDLEMGVTHIFRADEFISSMPRFLSLYDALSKVTKIDRPFFAALPPIMAPNGKKKLGKRDGAKSILDYKDEGYLPDAMMNFLAFIGWNPGDEREVFSPTEFVEAFSIDGIQKAGGQLNEDKLDWLNKEHIKMLPTEDVKEKIISYISEHTKKLDTFNLRIDSIVPLIKERIVKFKDVSDMEEQGELQYFFTSPEYSKDILLCAEKQRKGKEHFTVKDLKPIFETLKELLNSLKEDAVLSPESIKEALWPFADAEGRGLVLWALRTSLSGKERSPDPFVLVSVLGIQESVQRIDIALQKLSHE
jgi:glutamyl-tRNA synthetase